MSQELIQRADLVLANLQTNGGILNPEQADRFIQVLVDEPTILNVARTVTMAGPTMELNKIGFGSRIMRAAVENTRLAAADRVKPTTSKVSLATKEVIAEILLPYAVLEDNIEKGNLENTILTLIAKRAATDFEELVILGDQSLAGTDPYLGLLDGVVKRITAHEVDALTTGISANTFNNALTALPKKYRRNKNLLKFLLGSDAEQDWRNKIAARQTILGDSTLVGSAPSTVHGVGILPAALMPDGVGILTNPQNIIIGIQRNFRLESFRMIGERQYQIVLTARVDVQIEETDAAVKIVNFEDIEA